MKFSEFSITYDGRCKKCFMRDHVCICSSIVPYNNQTKLTVIMHHREVYKTTNTSRIAKLALSNCDIFLRGNPDHPLDLSTAIPNPEECYFLTLRDTAEELTPELVDELKLKHLVVPDGNWRQARKMGRREPTLGKARWIKMTTGPKSEYLLRKEPCDEGLATLEAIARALRIIEGPEISEHLLAAFRLMVTRTMNTRPKNRQA